ncbi:MAG: DUF1553 domain-containing protein [Planctomycetaceae bacterium]|nr:DUF1553 domain-containing protein [Planctomycetaceae bacterium]
MLLLTGLLSIVLPASQSNAQDQNQPEQNQPEQDRRLAFFETRIRPVLIQHCYECHAAGAKSIKGGLLLDSRDGLLEGGESGPSVVVGQPEESLLLEALRHESFEMPPQKRLDDTIIQDFATWVRDGLVDPRTATESPRPLSRDIDLDKGREFWSFRPVTSPPVPRTDTPWAITDIDRFVESKWKDAEIIPTPDATPSQIARRLFMVLTGLPPNADQIRHFVTAYEAAPDAAVASLTDELLASPRFGERWGRHWLDVVRFAESSGGGRSLMFPDAWRFRDYVIQSFNEDKPYSQFLKEHVAGDLLPSHTDSERDEQLVGSGFLVLGAINYEQQDKETLRMDVIDEQITAIGQGFLGMTLGCARCHNHKFDPVPTEDYYALAGILHSTKALTPGNVSGYVTTNLRTGFDPQELEQWKKTDAELAAQIEQIRKRLTPTTSASERRAISADSLPGIVVDDDVAIFVGEWMNSSHSAPFVGVGYRHSNSPRTGVTAEFRAIMPADGMYAIRMSHNSADSRSAKVPVSIRHSRGTAKVNVNQQRAANADGVFSSLGEYHFDAGEEAVVTIHADQASAGYVIVDAVQFIPLKELADVQDSSAPAETSGPDQQQLTETLKQLEKDRKTHAARKPAIPLAMSVTDEDSPGDWHLHIRGDARNLGPIVPRGFLQVGPADTTSARPIIPEGTSGRRELADWLTSVDNPLTARVYVNRVWQHAIGEGLVRTPDNFGTTGRPPDHPELLDHLAWNFMHSGQWSTRQLLRAICTSRVFRLSSEVTAAAQAKDPDNRWLGRGFRRRLDAEVLRDAILQISGELDLTFDGGRTIQHVTQYDNEYDHQKYASRHRSVYVPFLRNSMLDFFEVFDVANPNLVTGRRNVSTLPGQALFLMNSPFLMEQAEHAARRLMESASGDGTVTDQQIETVWLNVLGRQPTGQEVTRIQVFLNSSDPIATNDWTAVYQALFGSVDFRYLD